MVESSSTVNVLLAALNFIVPSFPLATDKELFNVSVLASPTALITTSLVWVVKFPAVEIFPPRVIPLSLFPVVNVIVLSLVSKSVAVFKIKLWLPSDKNKPSVPTLTAPVTAKVPPTATLLVVSTVAASRLPTTKVAAV